MAKHSAKKKITAKPKVEEKVEEKVDERYCSFCLRTDNKNILTKLKDREYSCEVCGRG